jgi:LysM repeat protein
MKHNLFRSLWSLVVILLVAAACTPASTTPVPGSGELTPYVPSATTTSTPTGVNTPTLLPSPTSTPQYYTLGKNDTLSYVAWAFGVNISDLLTANPKLDPYVLSKGTVVVVPAAQPKQTGTPGAFAATPVGVDLGKPACHLTAEGGAWCFLLVKNNQKTAVENLSASVRLADKNASQVLSQSATALLDVLPAGSSIPLAAYFAPPLPSPFQTDATLDTALPVQANDTRYLAAHLEATQSVIAGDGGSALESGKVVLDDNKASASQVWIAAAAYDKAGNVLGLRRWENSQPLAAGQALDFSFQVYSLGGTINHVDLLVEARP